MSIGEKIKKFRKEAGLTQVELAKRANMSRSYLGDLEGNRYNPSVSTLNAIADALDVKVSDLMEEKVKESDWDSKLPELTEKDEKDITKELERIINKLSSNGYSAFDGETIDEMDEEDKELLIASLENSMRLAKRMAKQKFTPKKYRK